MDAVGGTLARPWLFVALLVLHGAWVVVNLGVVPGLPPWDPPPFALLATIASAEAPFLSLLVLMRQQRDERIAELRQELQLQIIIGIDEKVSRENRMSPMDPRNLLHTVRRELDAEEGPMQGEADEGD